MLKIVIKVLRSQYPRGYRQAALIQNVSHSMYDVMLPYTPFPDDIERERSGQIVPNPDHEQIINTY